MNAKGSSPVPWIVDAFLRVFTGLLINICLRVRLFLIDGASLGTARAASLHQAFAAGRLGTVPSGALCCSTPLRAARLTAARARKLDKSTHPRIIEPPKQHDAPATAPQNHPHRSSFASPPVRRSRAGCSSSRSQEPPSPPRCASPPSPPPPSPSWTPTRTSWRTLTSRPTRPTAP